MKLIGTPLNQLTSTGRSSLQSVKVIGKRTSVVVSTQILMSILLRLRNLNSPISGSYTFRYTQTAWGIRSFAEGSFNPISLETPILGPPWRIPFEFPLFQMVAGSVSRFASISPSAAGRLTALMFFVATALIFFRLLQKYVSDPVACIFLGVFLFCSHNLEYGSAVLIEYCALFFGLFAFLKALKFLNDESSLSLSAFGILAVLSGLVKITTSVIWVGFGTLIALVLHSRKMSLGLRLLGVAVASQFPALVWTYVADEEKSKSIWTEWLTSSDLRMWNFGSMRQRFFYFEWHRSIFYEFFPSVIGLSFVAIVLLILGISTSETRRQTLLFCGLAASGPLVFTNLYFVHDYYWTAILPALLLAMAISMNMLITRLGRVSAQKNFDLMVFGTVAISALVLTSWFTPHGARHFDVFARPGRIDFNTDLDLVAVETLQKFTKEDDLIVVLGADWDPSILFFADRRGLMIRGALTDEQIQTISEPLTSYQYVLLKSISNMSGQEWKLVNRANRLSAITETLFKIEATPN